MYNHVYKGICNFNIIHRRATVKDFITRNFKKTLGICIAVILMTAFAFQVIPSNAAPVGDAVYRLNNGRNYLYTTSLAEKDIAISNYGYKYEGIVWYLSNFPTVYRLNNGYNYLYTTSIAEKDIAISNYGYRYEGIAWFNRAITNLTIANPTITLSKAYDGDTTATVTAGALAGVVSGETVTVSAVATYNSASVGTGKTITVVYTLAGADAAKYVKPANYTVATGVITTKQLTIAAPTVTLTKPYDGDTTVATCTPDELVGIVGEEVATVTCDATYDNATVGTGKTINVVYGALGGANAANYIKPVNGSVATGVITAITITTSVVPGVTAPATGETPVSTTTATDQYTGTVVWAPTSSPFAETTEYTAYIYLTPTENYTLTGVGADFFSVAGATGGVTNAPNSGTVTAIFPATETVDTAALTIAINTEYSDGAARTTHALLSTDYTVGTWDDYNDAIDAAIVIEGDTSATQAAVDDAAALIASTKAALVTNVAADGLTAAKATETGLTAADYVDYSGVTAALAMDEVTNTQILAKTTAINDAIAALVTLEQAEADKITVIALGPISVGDGTTVLQKAQALVAVGYTVTVKAADGTYISAAGIATSAGAGSISFTVTEDANSLDVADTATLNITVYN